MPTTPDETTRFEGATPILSVARLSASVRYYVHILGFTNAAWDTGTFTLVSRDAGGIYLCQGAQGHPGTWAWIGVEDVALLHQEYSASGATLRQMPRNYSYPELRCG